MRPAIVKKPFIFLTFFDTCIHSFRHRFTVDTFYMLQIRDFQKQGGPQEMTRIINLIKIGYLLKMLQLRLEKMKKKNQQFDMR